MLISSILTKDDWDGLLKRTKKSLEIKRKVIIKYMNNSLFPYTKRYLGTLWNHFSTIGMWMTLMKCSEIIPMIKAVLLIKMVMPCEFG